MKIKRLLLLVVFLFLLLPTSLRAQGFVFPNNPVVGQEVTGPGGVVYRWDGTKWVTVAPSFAGVGPCITGQYVTRLNASAPPTCAAPPAALPVNNPTYTGTMVGSMLNLLETSASSIRWGSNFTLPGAALSGGTSGTTWTHGAFSNGTNWVATANAATIIQQGNGEIVFYADNGLTVGASFNPSIRLRFQPLSGYPWVYVNNNATTGLQVGDMFVASVGAGNYNLVGGAYYDGGNWTSTINGQSFLVNQIANEGIGIYYANASYSAGQHVGWTREVLVRSDGLHLLHNLHVSGQIYSNAAPWNGNPTVNSGPRQVWLCNGCECAVGKSGVVIVTEGSHWGVTCAWALGGGSATLMQTSRPDQDWCRNWPNWGQISVHNAGAGYYNLGNYMAGDAWFTIMMLQTRDST